MQGRAGKRGWWGLGLLLLSCLLAGCAAPWPPLPAGRAAAAGSFAPALQRGLPWIVGVYGLVDRRPAADETQADDGGTAAADPMDPDGLLDVRIGAGFVIDAEGRAVTAAHVVQEAQQVVVRLPDQRVLRAQVLAIDDEADIALLQLPPQAWPAGRPPGVLPPLGSATRLRPGDWVLAVGEPYGLNRSVTAGVVGGTDRHFGDDHELLFIQSDLALNPGNSGGPLLDASGAIVGLNLRTMAGVYGTPGVSLSVPIEIVLQVAAELRSGGDIRRPRLGAQFTDLAPPMALLQGWTQAQGALLVGVASGSLAERIGLRAGDVVVGMNGRAVSGSADFARQLLAWRQPQGTQFVVRRGPQAHTVVVMPAALD